MGHWSGWQWLNTRHQGYVWVWQHLRCSCTKWAAQRSTTTLQQDVCLLHVVITTNCPTLKIRSSFSSSPYARINRCRCGTFGKNAAEAENICSKTRKGNNSNNNNSSTKTPLGMGVGKGKLRPFVWVTPCFWAVVEATNGYFQLPSERMYQHKVQLATLAAFSLPVTMMFVLNCVHTSNANTTRTFVAFSLTAWGSDSLPFDVGTASTFSFSLFAKPSSHRFIKLSSMCSKSSADVRSPGVFKMITHCFYAADKPENTEKLSKETESYGLFSFYGRIYFLFLFLINQRSFLSRTIRWRSPVQTLLNYRMKQS